MTFVTAASVDHSQGRKVNKEYLLLIELCSGGDLAQLLRRVQAPLSPQNVCLVLACLARSLSALHARSPPVTHRDIKLENLLLDDEGIVKLCDYGVSQHLASPDALIKDQCGTPAYMAPEVFECSEEFSGQQADVWSLGVCLFAMLCGMVPFKGRSVTELRHNIIN